MSAMRNLNGYEVNGRALRVDFAEKETKGRPGGATGPAAIGVGAESPMAAAGMGGPGGPMLPGIRRVRPRDLLQCIAFPACRCALMVCTSV